MSKKESEELPADWIQRKLAALRRKEEDTDSWPPTADQLVLDLALQGQAPAIEENDDDMLSIVVDDALAGHDIAKLYPTFFAKMIANPRLYAAFIDTVEMLEADQNDKLTPLPDPPSRDLHFLQARPAYTPQISHSKKDGWRITWELLQNQLHELFFPNPDGVYRYGRSLLEDESLILIHDEVTMAGQSLVLLLEAVWPVAEPEILRLQIMIVTEQTIDSIIQAQIKWGQYTAKADLDAYGRARFPDTPLNAIMDADGRLHNNSLQLILEHASI